MIIKICGIRDLAMSRVAVDHGATLIGFNFYPPSPRYVEPSAARAIIAELPKAVGAVGVFVNEPVKNILKIIELCELAAVQLHGDEEPDVIAEIQANCPVMKAMPLQDENDLLRADRYPNIALLVDTPCPEWGGSGEVGNWELARKLAGRRKILLAGGLTPANVADAIRTVQPAGVDVSSGVERQRGEKDPDLIREFLAAARNIHKETE